MTPAGTNLLLAHADATPAPADVVTKSLRITPSSYLQLTSLTSTPTDSQKFTASFWMKRWGLGDVWHILGGGTSGTNWCHLSIRSNDQFAIDDYHTGNDSTTYNIQWGWSPKFRDVAAWYHCVLVFDGTLSSAADKYKLYINNVEQPRSHTTNTPPTPYTCGFTVGSIYQSWAFNTDGSTAIGKEYLADCYIIDGQALTPSHFAEEDATTGQWKPKAYSGTGYGTNGSHLDFNDSSDIGNDVSGEGNDFTATNLAASDVVPDCPTNNYCTFNALNAYSAIVDMLAEGNLRVTTATGASGYQMMSTMGVSSGKWYYEYRDDSPSTRNTGVGWVDSKQTPTGSGAIFYHDYIYVNGGGASAGAQLDNGDIAGVALDADAGKIWFSLNGTWWDSQDPAAGSNAKYTASTNSDIWVPSFMDGNYGQGTVNYGQDGTFNGTETAQGNADGNGHGDFYYSPPSGFLALCSKNLPTPTIAKGEDYFNALTYASSGAKTFDNGTTTMQPDLVWVKARGDAYDHELTDSVRGVTKALSSNAINVESTDSTGLTAFGTDGFTVGAGTNYSTSSMVAWSWKKSATAGFNIVGWTGDDDGFSGGTQAVAHGLGVAPEMVIAKNRTDEAGAILDGGGNWIVYHKDTASGDLLKLNTTGGEFTPNSTLIGSIGSTNVSFGNDSLDYEYLNSDNSFGSGTPDTYIGYFFASVESYSKVGKWVGSGVSGKFIYLGFRPQFLIYKHLAEGHSWGMMDNARGPYNAIDEELAADQNWAEFTSTDVDFLSNGFCIYGTGGHINQSGEDYIFCAVAKNPFKYASAR